MLFLSIHPNYVDAILDGRKTVELRKRRPRAQPGSIVVIYATMPRCAVVATAVMGDVQAMNPDQLWSEVGEAAAVSQQQYVDYFANSAIAVAIHLSQVCQLKNPVKLAELRKLWDGFHPPQQFRYLDPIQQAFIRKRQKVAIGLQIG